MHCHRFDLDTPLEDTIEIMDSLIRAGKIINWGVCRWTALQLSQATQLATANNFFGPKTNQYFYNIFNREVEHEIINACISNEIGLITYSPLAQGVLSGKYSLGNIGTNTRAYSNEKIKTMWDLNFEKLELVTRLKKISDHLNVSLANLCLSWCLKSQKISTVIFGARTLDQLNENINAINLQIPQDLLVKIDQIFEGNKL